MGSDNGIKGVKSYAGFSYNPSISMFNIMIMMNKYSAFPSIKWTLLWNFLCIGGIIAFCEVCKREESCYDAKTQFDAVAAEAFKLYRLWFPFISIIGGFYAAAAYTRWWTMRDKLRSICGGAVSTAMYVGSEVKDIAARKEMVRYLSVAQALVIWTARTFHGDKDGDGDLDAEDTGLRDPYKDQPITTLAQWLEYLVAKGTLTERERSIIEPAKAPFHLPYQWFLTLLAQCDKKGLLSNHVASRVILTEQISAERGAVTAMMMHLSTPTPFPYFYMFRVITGITILFAPLALAGTSKDGIATYPLEVLGTLFCTFVAGSLFFTGVALSDPFGHDVCDFDLESEWQKSEKLMTQQVTLDATYPHIPALDAAPLTPTGAGVTTAPAYGAGVTTAPSYGASVTTAPSYGASVASAPSYAVPPTPMAPRELSAYPSPILIR